MRTVISILAATGISCFSLKFFALPYVWTSLSWSFFFFLQTKRSVRGAAKTLWFNIGALLLVFAIFESVLSIMDYRDGKVGLRTHLERVYESRRDDILGYAPRKDTTRRARKYINDNLIYDVVISIDKNGLRISPPCQKDSKNAVLFFGDSYTFGEGVNDNQTMPFCVGLELDGEYCIYNFGCYGYGTHQMLAGIENGLVTSIVKQDLHYAIYLALYPEHVYRLSGVRPWPRGPKFVLGKDGRPHYAGLYRDNDSRYGFWILKIKRQLMKSALIKRFVNLGIQIRETDKDLFVAMVSQSRQLLLEQHPMAEFHMIVWPTITHIDTDKYVFDKLISKDINIHFIEDILPGIHNSYKTYSISELDRHPNALAHRMVAQYILNHIIH